MVGFLYFYFFLKLLSAVLHNHLLEQDYKNTTTPSEFVSVGTLLVVVGWSVCRVSFCEFDWILTSYKEGFLFLLFCFVFFGCIWHEQIVQSFNPAHLANFGFPVSLQPVQSLLIINYISSNSAQTLDLTYCVSSLKENTHTLLCSSFIFSVWRQIARLAILPGSPCHGHTR